MTQPTNYPPTYNPTQINSVNTVTQIDFYWLDVLPTFYLGQDQTQINSVNTDWFLLVRRANQHATGARIKLKLTVSQSYIFEFLAQFTFIFYGPIFYTIYS